MWLPRDFYSVTSVEHGLFVVTILVINYNKISVVVIRLLEGAVVKHWHIQSARRIGDLAGIAGDLFSFP